MAQLDVSELMSDPDFSDPIVLINRVSSSNLHGENVLQECPVKTYGSVQPSPNKTIDRLPDELRTANVKSFWVRGGNGTIIASGPGKYPSILVFKGQRYVVQLVFDWSNFGEGYTEGVCVVERPT
jgi:hypothetical protein